MGSLDIKPVIEHFSHHHPLQLQNNESQNFLSLYCAGCKKPASGSIYYCDTCKYCLHKTCSSLPQTYKHKADNKHPLVLLCSPAYPQGVFGCNACGSNGTGFCYHCQECQIDIHPVCAFMPFNIENRAHNHVMELCFKPPYADGRFSCDICGELGLNSWLYRCDACQFDAHMKCAKNPPQVRVQARSVESVLGSQQRVVTSRSVRGQPPSPVTQPPPASPPPVMQPPPPVMQPPPQVLSPACSCGGGSSGSFHYGHGNMYAGPTGLVGGVGYMDRPQRTGSGIKGRVVEEIVEVLANQAGQALFQALTDGS